MKFSYNTSSVLPKQSQNFFACFGRGKPPSYKRRNTVFFSQCIGICTRGSSKHDLLNTPAIHVLHKLLLIPDQPIPGKIDKIHVNGFLMLVHGTKAANISAKRARIKSCKYTAKK